MKTKLYVPPGTELDWDNENHRRILEEEAYAGYDDHPKPTMKPPERSRFWWFWRFFGLFFYVPARRILHRYMAHRYVPTDYVRKIDGHNVFDWPLAGALHEWIDRGIRSGPKAFWLRRLLHWITDIHAYSQCLHCGFTEFDAEITIYSGPDDTEGRDINLFEHVEGGGVDYWGEGQDAYGWMWCYRCGSVAWEAT